MGYPFKFEVEIRSHFQGQLLFVGKRHSVYTEQKYHAYAGAKGSKIGA